MSYSTDFNSLMSFYDFIISCISLEFSFLFFFFDCGLFWGLFLFFQVQYIRPSWTGLYVTNHIMTPVELCSFKISWVIVCYEYILIPMSCEQICSHSLSWAICFFIFVPGLISVRFYSLPDKNVLFYTHLGPDFPRTWGPSLTPTGQSQTFWSAPQLLLFSKKEESLRMPWHLSMEREREKRR